ncbi:MAG: riboflavin synthase [Paracoccaceae bacterium]
MFTGIISDIGTILELEQRGDLRVRIGCSYDLDSIDVGCSICCNGICLTVIECGNTETTYFDVEISSETISKTNTQHWIIGTELNLERALRLGDELGGHIVSGHVDGVVKVLKIEDQGDSTKVEFEIPEPLAKFCASKGSVSLNGTSLTINEVDESSFSVNLISHTKLQTNWKSVRVNDEINLEVDTLARYVSRLKEYD